MTLRLRPATIDDRDAIVEVFLGCWRQSYAGVLPQSVIASMTDKRAAAMWNRLLEGGAGTTLIAEDGPRVIGVTRFETADGTGIVQSLYVSPEARGQGVGSLLLGRAADDMTAEAPRSLVLWVFADNVSSIGFYARLGWLPDGESRTQDEFGVPELRLGFQEATP